jgi:hypothetical protein
LFNIIFQENKRTSYSKEKVDILKNWFYANSNNPYTTIEIKEDLARKTNLTIQQVTFWLSNERKKSSLSKENTLMESE